MFKILNQFFHISSKILPYNVQDFDSNFVLIMFKIFVQILDISTEIMDILIKRLKILTKILDFRSKFNIFYQNVQDFKSKFVQIFEKYLVKILKISLEIDAKVLKIWGQTEISGQNLKIFWSKSKYFSQNLEYFYQNFKHFCQNLGHISQNLAHFGQNLKDFG